MNTTKGERKLISLALVAGICLFLPAQNVWGMHIMEGYLPAAWCIGWGALCLPFVAVGFVSIRRRAAESTKNLVLLAMCGAFAFVLSAMKIPSVTGSCSHPTGVGLGAILFGPCAMSLIGVIILLFQAILLAHGGLTTLGANVFSMAIVGPLVSFGVFKLMRRLKVPFSISVFLAAFLGDLLTYVTTSFQLGMAFPGDNLFVAVGKFLGVFAVTQLPLAVCEGLLTVVVMNVLVKYSHKELMSLHVLDAGRA